VHKLLTNCIAETGRRWHYGDDWSVWEMRRAQTRNGREVVVTVSPASVRRHLEKEARRRLGLSAREMIVRYRRGKLKDVGRVADLIVWSDALPENDPIFEAS
jgi:hypothetical protein